MLVATEQKGDSVHETEISIASISVQERKEKAMSKSRNCKRELEDLQAGVKYHKIYHIKKESLKMKARQPFPEKSWNKKKKKRMISKLIPDLLSCPTHLHGNLAPKKVVEKERSKKKLPFCIYDDFHAHLVKTNLKTQKSNMHGK